MTLFKTYYKVVITHELPWSMVFFIFGNFEVKFGFKSVKITLFLFIFM
jgi:hypothetical protein